jgi:hypothetical protein
MERQVSSGIRDTCGRPPQSRFIRKARNLLTEPCKIAFEKNRQTTGKMHGCSLRSS